MKTWLEWSLSMVLQGWIGWVQRHASVVLIISVGLTILSVYACAVHLGVNTDTTNMLSRTLRFREIYQDFKQFFPQFTENLVVVVKGNTPEHAERAAARLADHLRDQKHLFRRVYLPESSPFLRKHRLLYADLSQLNDLSENLLRMEPLVRKITRDPQLAGLFSLLSRSLQSRQDSLEFSLVEPKQTLEDVAPLIKSMNRVLESYFRGSYEALSWQNLILESPSRQMDRRRLVILQTRPDFDRLLVGERFLKVVRRSARSLGLTPDHGVEIRLTGEIALTYEELLSALRSTQWAGLLSLMLVFLILLLALRSVRLVCISLFTLVLGLLWTAGFAAVTVGNLNLISLAFAVLYIGLGIDYAIHYGLRYQELLQNDRSVDEALKETASSIGLSLTLCTVTTAVGFYSFVPTSYVAVSELGWIGGTGIFINLAATLTLIPALLTTFHDPSVEIRGPRGTVDPAPLLKATLRYRRWILAGVCALGALSLLSLGSVPFDPNPMNLRDPSTESVRTFNRLMNDSQSLLSAQAIGESDSEAQSTARKLRQRPAVKDAITLERFVPRDQNRKLTRIRELAQTLQPEFWDVPSEPASVQPGTVIESSRTLIDSIDSQLERHSNGGNHRDMLKSLRGKMQKLLATLQDQNSPPPENHVQTLNERLIGPLLWDLRVFQRSLSVAEPITPDKLPRDLIRRWVSPEGFHRIEITPALNLNDQNHLRKFVHQVRSVAPDATGGPVIFMEAGRAAVDAFQTAFLIAGGSMFALLGLMVGFRRDVWLVMAPLLLAGLLLNGSMLIVGLDYNFANLIVLPLLLGIGVDNGIHIVQRFRHDAVAGERMFESSTARAVFFSTITTIGSFGNLMIASHRGMFSMGALLTIGMFLILLCTLLFLPLVLTEIQGTPARE